ncbi:MAG TPA: FHA domain-containing protein [Candidatus Scybalomonas excrementigallinarum]|nr:FHA domain-containing protein [Candidatus Scybalomonas excrementigallinarum]
MKDKNIQAIGWDIGILGILSIFLLITYFQLKQRILHEPFAIVAIIGWLFVGCDLIIQIQKGTRKKKREEITAIGEVRQLVLLDEAGRPIKTWDMAGRVSLVIGKKNKEENVDVDLSDCAYSALIEDCHAVLNYSSGSWFVEDLSLENGIRIKKVEDGICYQVMKRPCKVLAGDILYIANTKILLT